MNVTELARKLKVPTKELLEKLPELGFDIGKKAIKIDSRLIDKITKSWVDHKRKERMIADEEKVTEVRLDDQQEEKKLEKTVAIPYSIIVREFAEKLNLPVNKLMVELMKNGIMGNLNQAIDFDTATIIGEDLGYKVTKITDKEIEEKTSARQEQKLKDIIDNQKNKATRPPVVVVMGHVDHGKTKLLDAFRETNVIDTESGGITQHIGAYQAKIKDRLITFLDTPGHEAFKTMRSRGSKIADVAIIVVAADDGLQPQTIEVITLCQKENLPFIIAINKIDKDNADPERVKKELSDINLVPEDWGGKTVCMLISAKQKKNLAELLEMVLLIADMEELKSNPDALAAGTIIEAHKDRNEGPVATVLVQTGTLRVGDTIAVGTVTGKIKAMRDEFNKEVTAAPPAKPVKILGLKETPAVGDVLEAIDDPKLLKQRMKDSKRNRTTANSHDSFADQGSDDENAIPTLPIILKADVVGSQEAIIESLMKLNTAKAQVKIIKRGLGNITENDILEAQAAKAMLIGFHVKTAKSAETLAMESDVTIHSYEIIYKLLEDVAPALNKIKAQETLRVQLGELKVLAIFKSDKHSMIIGGEIIKGKVQADKAIKITRDGEFVDLGTIKELQCNKEIVTEAVEGQQCGITYQGRPVIQVDDILEVYQETTE
ncbi:MAG: translation initiation factor IF-2 [Parcubacteria group bacterium CG1_02_37_51]|uniref:Translation initiation factor IF-2 n=2 Tax=Candidatus Komeiliibacteriota TaxID=1817908 RepID=A0A2M8DRA2_9BACT|nr:MAG: translation initiation factor IF-2 [Parcubacteria group bacterium CG1_02_37_51]PIY94301.1 MAG: translation initiation factor IF-2 [Candidatus Komeilibacteria bacterium CG_4_10_14_0_8_um_filter_37_78]PJC01915.1 MAG: translation initiation factor IF-2 [Candidatus Komeilibacteria bacterium CG_4_9_14_0_8_um_filter_36_9]